MHTSQRAIEAFNGAQNSPRLPRPIHPNPRHRVLDADFIERTEHTNEDDLRIGVRRCAATILGGALESHAVPVERVYLVHVERSANSATGLSDEWTPPRKVRIATRRNRFYVEMNRGRRQRS